MVSTLSPKGQYGLQPPLEEKTYVHSCFQEGTPASMGWNLAKAHGGPQAHGPMAPDIFDSVAGHSGV